MRCIAFLAATAVLTPVAVAGWAPDPEYIVALNMPFFRDKSPEQIARFLAHHNGLPYGAAVKSLAACGDKAVPLLEKLLGDTNPWIRAGAVDTLGEMNKVQEAPKKGAETQREVTPQLKQVVALVGKLVDDPHPAVQAALGSFVEKTRVETEATRRIILKMAASSDPSVRFKTLHMGRYWLRDRQTLIRIAATVSAAPEGNTPNHWNWAHMIVQRFAADRISRQAIPAMAAFLRNKANTVPYRGFFSDGAQFRALEVMLAQWDTEIEKTPGLVAGVCRSYVRVPQHKYAGWVKTRKLAKELLEKLSPSSAPAVRATIAEERKWLAEVDDVQLQSATETKPAEAREKCLEYIGYLEGLAERLEKQK